MSKRRELLNGCMLVLLLLFVPGWAEASLSRYVQKHRNIQVTHQQSQKIARYDYLIQYYSSIAYFRAGHKVNADFIRALMLAESNGDPKAISPKDARGLCQITFPTGKQAATELAQKNIRFKYVSRNRLLNLRPNDLYNPAINVLLTCYLISKYNFQFQGKLDLVVAAWNAGEHSITNNRPPQYQETLNLIGKVNGYFIHFLNM
ncbi:MAG: lytic murein transglycosylase [Desulfobulbus propionicus]|nr:MAG: lytic murein transglycosylase [Desulfobulbus propionicus]PIE63670.1 MAG: lytic murein transglycosylase [Desulfobacterales bacterium]